MDLKTKLKVYKTRKAIFIDPDRHKTLKTLTIFSKDVKKVIDVEEYKDIKIALKDAKSKVMWSKGNLQNYNNIKQELEDLIYG